MSRIRGRDTKPEILLRKACWQLGMRYSLNAKLPGRPDFVFARQKVAVFVDGCFWHGCPLHYQAPATRAEFWKLKIDGTKARDRRVNEQLTAAGWTVCRVWEHTITSDLIGAVSAIATARAAPKAGFVGL